MNSHKHARLTAKGRALLVGRVLEKSWSVVAASDEAGVSERTATGWPRRHSAIIKASATSCEVMLACIDQPTTRRE